MAREPQIPKRDIQRARKVLEFERINAPYRKPNAFGSCLLFVLALAIAGAIVFYIFIHKEQFGQLWQRATHPDSLPGQTVPGR
ncbi:MAG: hypothetical protein NTX53_10135 [candidate division WOR-3 bacterium]|nr:hypothetical protein [candidate division WOR-3 bacterium]